MRPEKKSKHVAVASSTDGGGGIDVLPDDILEHILGFLPSDEAGRTSVLARRWRHRWKFATALNVTCIIEWPDYRRTGKNVLEKCQKAVEDMLHLRDNAPLEACHLTFGSFCHAFDKICLSRWVRHVVMCGVQRFRLVNFYCHEALLLHDQPLVSRNLTRLELVGVELSNKLCDFSSCCPALQHLDIDHCILWDAQQLSSQSMKMLSITSCDFSTKFNTLIHVPNLVSLNLDSHLYRPPVLGSMPSLKKAFVRVPIGEYCFDEDTDPLECFCCHIMIEHNKCFLLDGLSNAENLALLSETTMSQRFSAIGFFIKLTPRLSIISPFLSAFIQFAFENDLKRCPTFSNLKTLRLNENWCVAPHFAALTCILKHSHVLEKLTLELNSRGPEHKVEIIGGCHPMDGSSTKLEHLKTIEIKCEVVDEEIHKVLQFLCTFNICFIFK